MCETLSVLVCGDLGRRWLPLAVGAIVFSVVAFGMSRPAFAQVGQWSLGPRAGAVVSSGNAFGPIFGSHLARQVGEAMQWVAAVDYSAVEFEEADHGMLQVMAGLRYRFDVLRWVPHVSAKTGYVGKFGETGSASGFGFQLEAGVDYLLSRAWAAGLGYGLTLAPDALANDPVAERPLHALQFSLTHNWGL